MFFLMKRGITKSFPRMILLIWVKRVSHLGPLVHYAHHHHVHLQCTLAQDQFFAFRHRGAVLSRRACADLHHIPLSQALQPRIKRIWPSDGNDVRFCTQPSALRPSHIKFHWQPHVRHWRTRWYRNRVTLYLATSLQDTHAE